MASGHLVGKKAWQDLACLFKKKKTAWVGGDYSIFMLILVSSLSLPKAASKLVSALLFAAFREQRGVWAGALRKSRLGLLSFFCRAGRSWTELVLSPCCSSLRGYSMKKGQRQQKAMVLRAMGISPLV